jgi:hypothetical protein
MALHEEMGDIGYISCSPDCLECQSSLSNPKKIPESISDLNERLDGLRHSNQLDALVWLADFKQLGAQLLRFVNS